MTKWIAGCSGCLLIVLGAVLVIFVFSSKAPPTEKRAAVPSAFMKKANMQATPVAPFASEADIKAEAKLLHDSGVSLFPEDRKKALVLLEQAFRKEPSNTRYSIDLADAYSQMGDALSGNFALSIYKGLSDENPGCDMLLARLADSYAKIYRYNDAFDTAARRTWNKNVSPVDAVSQIVLFSVVSGDFTRGISEVRKVLETFPCDKEEIELMLAGLYVETGNKKAAIAIIENVIASLPEAAPAALKAREMKRELGSGNSLVIPPKENKKLSSPTGNRKLSPAW